MTCMYMQMAMLTCLTQKSNEKSCVVCARVSAQARLKKGLVSK